MSELFDHRAEAAVISAILAAPGPTMKALSTIGMESGHFHFKECAGVFRAMKQIESRGLVVNVDTVKHELERTRSTDTLKELSNLLIDVDPQAVRQYGERVIELAEWRHRRYMLSRLETASKNVDKGLWDQTTAELSTTIQSGRTDTFSPERWADLIYSHLAQTDPVRSISLPIKRLSDALYGGLWPGEVMVVSGHTSMGKSLWADQIMDHAAKEGFRCHAYLTEMSALTRGLRLVTRKTGIPFGKLRRGNLAQHEVKLVLDALEELPYGITIAGGWDIDQVVADALYARWDLVVIDLIHGFRYDDERGLDRLSKAMQRLAISSTTLDGFRGTSIIGIAHINRGSANREGKRMRPTLSSLKGGSSIEQDADFVMFVHQEEDEKGLPTGTGSIYIPKGRSGDPVDVPVTVNPMRMRFEDSL